MVSNKKLGNDFETQFCEYLFNNGFWVHNMTQNVSGQPADVLAARNGKTYLIDCKVCTDDKFVLSRIEENQNLSMKLWEETGNSKGLFAIHFGSEKGTIMITHNQLQKFKGSSVTSTDLLFRGVPLIKWVQICE